MALPTKTRSVVLAVVDIAVFICSFSLSQHTVNMVQVVEHLTGKGVSREEAVEVHIPGPASAPAHVLYWFIQFFSEVDRDGEGHVDIAYLLMVRCVAQVTSGLNVELQVLKDRPVDPMQALIPCHLRPGPLEVYLPGRCEQGEASRKLVQVRASLSFSFQ